MTKIPETYKGLTIAINNNYSKYNASYNKFSQVIVIYPNFSTLSNIKQKSILEHEYAHHVYYKMPLAYKKIWQYLSNGKLINLLNIMGITKCKKNAYVSEYAKTNVKEDFAECIEKKVLGESFKTFAQFKMDTANSMYNYYSKK